MRLNLKKCDDEKHPIYNIKRSSVCGVYGYRNIRNASCGVESYKRCIPDPVKYRDKYSAYIYYATIEDGGTYSSHWEDGMGSNDHCRKIGNNKPWMKLDMFKSKDPNSYYEMASFTRYTEDLRDLIFNNRVKARHYCEFTLNYKSAQYFPVRDQVCGVEKYNVCSQELFIINVATLVMVLKDTVSTKVCCVRLL